MTRTGRELHKALRSRQSSRRLPVGDTGCMDITWSTPVSVATCHYGAGSWVRARKPFLVYGCSDQPQWQCHLARTTSNDGGGQYPPRVRQVVWSYHPHTTARALPLDMDFMDVGCSLGRAGSHLPASPSYAFLRGSRRASKKAYSARRRASLQPQHLALLHLCSFRL